MKKTKGKGSSSDAPISSQVKHVSYQQPVADAGVGSSSAIVPPAGSKRGSGSKRRSGSARGSRSSLGDKEPVDLHGVSSEFISVIHDHSAENKSLKLGNDESPIFKRTQNRPSVGDYERSDVYYGDADLVDNSEENLRFLDSHKKGVVSLERWWLTSSLGQRLLPFMLLLLIVLSLAHLIYALVCFGGIRSEWETVEDPYVCNTVECQTISNTLREDMKKDVDPCVDFYDFTCGSYTNDDEDPDAIPTRVRVTHAYLIFTPSQEAILSKPCNY